MRTIYVDVLLAVNLVLDYLLLLLTAKFLRLPARRGRLLLGAAVGAAASLEILLPALPLWLDLPAKLLVSLAVTLAAFGYGGPGALLRQLLSFFLLSFAFAGIMLAAWYFVSPAGMVVKNSVVYFDVPPLLLVAMAGGCYLLLRLVQRLCGSGAVQGTVCRATVCLGGNSRSLRARVDTGCSLKEPFSGLPVMLAQASALPPQPSAPPRLVPYRSVGGAGLLKAWRAQQLRLCFPGKELLAGDCYVAYHEGNLAGEYQALLPPDLVQSARPLRANLP